MSIVGAVGHVLLLCGIALFVFQVRRLSLGLRWMALIICVGVGLVRIDGLRVVDYQGGLLGDLSITTQILLTCTIVKQVLRIDLLSDRDRCSILTAAVVTGLFLYPFSSGLSRFDLYSLGYHSVGLVVGLASAAIITWCFRPRVAVVISLAVIAFNLRLLASTNLWDYLLDPLLTLFAWGWALSVGTARILKPRTPGLKESTQP